MTQKRGQAGRRRQGKLRAPSSSWGGFPASRNRELTTPSAAGLSSHDYATVAGVALLDEACRIEGLAAVDPPDELDQETDLIQTEIVGAIAALLRQRGESDDMSLARAVSLARFERRRVWQRGGTVYEFRQALADRLQEVREM